MSVSHRQLTLNLDSLTGIPTQRINSLYMYSSSAGIHTCLGCAYSIESQCPSCSGSDSQLVIHCYINSTSGELPHQGRSFYKVLIKKSNAGYGILATSFNRYSLDREDRDNWSLETYSFRDNITTSL